MPTSELIHLIHWVIYLGSILGLILLFTRFRKWGAIWIAVLFASQVLFNGCIVVAWENHYRLQEGLSPFTTGLLTDRFSSNHTVEIIVSAIIALIAIAIFLLSLKD